MIKKIITHAPNRHNASRQLGRPKRQHLIIRNPFQLTNCDEKFEFTIRLKKKIEIFTDSIRNVKRLVQNFFPISYKIHISLN